MSEGEVKVPEKIGRYKITKELGSGKFSRVYEAEDPIIGRRVALKVVKDQAFSPRLRAEGNRLGQMEGHPNILNIHDVGTHIDDNNGDLEYLVLELCDSSFMDGADNAGGKNWRKSVKQTVEMLDGLEAMHKKGIIHRDLKPANVFIKKDHTRIGDFNLVTDDEAAQFMESILQSGFEFGGKDRIMGTAAYMAPEQKRGQPEATIAVNIHQAGQIMNERLTGRHLGEMGKDSASKIHPGIPKWIDDIVARATEFLPEDRYESAAEMADDLRKGLAGGFDGPTLSKRALEFGKKAAKFLGKALTSPLWGPLHLCTAAEDSYNYGKEGSSLKTFGLYASGFILTVTTYIAAPIAGLAGMEGYFERETKQVVEKVFAKQPDSLYIGYKDVDELKLLRVNKIMTKTPETIILPERVSTLHGMIVGEKDNKVIYYDRGRYDPNKIGSFNHQFYSYDPETKKTKGLIDYLDERNDWLRDNETFRPMFARDSEGKIFVAFKDSLSDLYTVNETGYVSRDASGKYREIKERKPCIQEDNLLIEQSGMGLGGYIQVVHNNDFWGDFELFKGDSPILVNINRDK